VIERFGADGLYLLDEPGAALSTQNCLTALRRIHELVRAGSQLIIATHSPIIRATPRRRSIAAAGTGSRRSSTRTPTRCA
jgi:predicted ATPase